MRKVKYFIFLSILIIMFIVISLPGYNTGENNIAVLNLGTWKK